MKIPAFFIVILAIAGSAPARAQNDHYQLSEAGHQRCLAEKAVLSGIWRQAMQQRQQASREAIGLFGHYGSRDGSVTRTNEYMAPYNARQREAYDAMQRQQRRCDVLSALLNDERSRERRERPQNASQPPSGNRWPSGETIVSAYNNYEDGRSALDSYRNLQSSSAAERVDGVYGFLGIVSGRIPGHPVAGLYREQAFGQLQRIHSNVFSQLDGLETSMANFGSDMRSTGYQYALSTGFRPMLAARNQAYARLEDAIQQLQQAESRLLPEQTAQLAALVAAVRGMQEAERRVAQARSNQAAAEAQRQLGAAQASAQAAAQAAAQQSQWEAEQQKNDDYERRARDAAIGQALGAAIGAFVGSRGGYQAPPQPLQQRNCQGGFGPTHTGCR
jgi:hypothetical protein